MPQYVIERRMPGAGGMSDEQWHEATRLSNKVLQEMGGEARWLHSYVTADKVYCVYEAPESERIREHGRLTGFPTDAISEVARVVDPAGSRSGA